MSRGVIYSAMIGGYGDIFPVKKAPGWDFIMFTDTPDDKLPIGTAWKFVAADRSKGANDTLINRWYKMHPHVLFPEYTHLSLIHI